MKVLVFGSKGQLGHALLASLPADVDVVGLSSRQVDIADPAAVVKVCRRERPDVVINAAAYTAVDKAEDEVDRCRTVNVSGAANVATATSEIHARLIHLSTDFVFDGKASTPYQPDAPANPESAYGRSKLDGERAVQLVLGGDAIILRTAWLYGLKGNNFVKTMLRLMRERDEISVVSDQTGSPTSAAGLAEVIWRFAAPKKVTGTSGTSPKVPVTFNREVTGTFHWTDAGETTWHGFALAIQAEAIALGMLDDAIPVHAITGAEFGAAAPRPAYSVLDCSATVAALDLQQTEWRANLHTMLKRLNN